MGQRWSRVSADLVDEGGRDGLLHEETVRHLPALVERRWPQLSCAPMWPPIPNPNSNPNQHLAACVQHVDEERRVEDEVALVRGWGWVGVGVLLVADGTDEGAAAHLSPEGEGRPGEA